MRRLLESGPAQPVKLDKVRLVSAGLRHAQNNAPVTPPLPPGWAPGDLFFTAVIFGSPGGTVVTPPGSMLIAELSNADGTLYAFARPALASDTPITYGVAGGVQGDGIIGGVAAFRGVSLADPIAALGPDTITTNPVNDIQVVGPGATGVVNGGVIMLGAQNISGGTSVTRLSGDGLSWVEMFDFSEGAMHVFLCADFAGWLGVAPIITDKTFNCSGSSTGTAYSKAIVLRAATL